MSVEVSVVGKFVLSAYLAELAWPISQHCGEAFVDEVRIRGFAGTIITSANEPSPPQLVVARSVEAKRTLFEGKLLSLAPDQFCPSHEGVINRSAQGLPAQGGVDSIKVGQKVRTGSAVAARIRGAEIEISRFCDVLISPQMDDGADVVVIVGAVQRMLRVSGVAAEDLPGQLHEYSFGSGKYALHGYAGIVNTILARHQVVARS